ncbi:MAG TPA: nucleotidyl transferase AbiEii/AbiGii toxin family protein [Candidatus Acidoferrales bacterium]
MKAEEVFELTTQGGTSDFARVVEICRRLGPYCLVGGLAVNCYVEPVYTLDADFVVVAEKVDELKGELKQQGFKLEEFPHSLNAKPPQSDIRIQFTADPRYQAFLSRAEEKLVLGVPVRVAALEDLVQGKLWAWQDPERRLTKKKKDELDLLRLAEAFPHLHDLYPPDLLRRFET